MNNLIRNLFAAASLFATTAYTAATAQPAMPPQAPAPLHAPVNSKANFVGIEDWKVTLVTARTVIKLGDVRELSDEFTYEGRIYAHATLTSHAGSQAGHQEFEMRWVNEGHSPSVQKAEYFVGKSPFYLSSSTSGTALGPGNCRVELYAAGNLLASHKFSVMGR